MHRISMNKLGIDPDDKIYIAGHRGLVGSVIVRKLKEKGFSNLIMLEHTELDLTNQVEVQTFFKKENIGRLGNTLSFFSSQAVSTWKHSISCALCDMGSL